MQHQKHSAPDLIETSDREVCNLACMQHTLLALESHTHFNRGRKICGVVFFFFSILFHSNERSESREREETYDQHVDDQNTTPGTQTHTHTQIIQYNSMVPIQYLHIEIALYCRILPSDGSIYFIVKFASTYPSQRQRHLHTNTNHTKPHSKYIPIIQN